MRRTASLRIVVDASVTHAAGDSPGVASACREVLTAILEICHRVVSTPQLREEREGHESRYARRWRRLMVSRKKLTVATPPEDPDLDERVLATARGARQRRDMAKDLRLLKAALATDRVVISGDRTVRSLFASAATAAQELRTVTWVVPDADNLTNVLAWLRGNPPADFAATLGERRHD